MRHTGTHAAEALGRPDLRAPSLPFFLPLPSPPPSLHLRPSRPPPRRDLAAADCAGLVRWLKERRRKGRSERPELARTVERRLQDEFKTIVFGMTIVEPKTPLKGESHFVS